MQAESYTVEEAPNFKAEISSYPPKTEPPSSRTGVDVGSLVQLIGSGLGGVTLLGLAALFAVQAVILIGSGEKEQVLPALLLATGTGFGGALTLPSAWFALLRLMGRRPATTLPRWFPRQGALLLLLLVIEPIALVIGNFLSREPSTLAWLLLPLLNILVITVPVIWLVHLACYGLPYGTPQRKWGVFASGLVLGPGIIIGLEIFIGLIVAMGVMVVLSTQTGMLATLQRLVEQISENPSMPPEQIVADLVPYFQKPVVAYAVVAFLAVLVPLMEELFKPIAVWLLAGRSLTASEGFVVGALCGAGFALMENLGYGAASMGNWVAILLARSGTAVMHITTSAMLGWALSATWRDGRYLRLAAIYLAAIAIHGLWNGITVGFGLLGVQITGTADSMVTYQVIAAAVLGLLLLALLVGMNAARRRAEALRQIEVQPHAIMPTFTSVSMGTALPPVETILSNEETPDDGISTSTG